MRELAGLLDQVLIGHLVDDWAAVERRVVVAVGALLGLLELHRVDERGRCSTCWRASRRWWWPWPTRATCTVARALGLDPRHPARFAPSAFMQRMIISEKLEWNISDKLETITISYKLKQITIRYKLEHLTIS